MRKLLLPAQLSATVRRDRSPRRKETAKTNSLALGMWLPLSSLREIRMATGSHARDDRRTREFGSVAVIRKPASEPLDFSRSIHIRPGRPAPRRWVGSPSLVGTSSPQFSAGDFVAGPWPVKYRNAVKLAA